MASGPGRGRRGAGGAAEATKPTLALFNQLVRDGDQRRRHRDPERFGGLEVDNPPLI